MAAYYGSYYNEHKLSEYTTALYGGSEDVACTYGEPFSSLDDIFHLCLNFNSSTSSKEEFSYDSFFPPHEFQNENGLNEEAYEREYVAPSIDSWNWQSLCNLGCGEEDFSRYSSCNNGYDSCLEKVEGFFQSQEQGEWNSSSCNNEYDSCLEKVEGFYQSQEQGEWNSEDLDKQRNCDYSFWDDYWSKIGYGEEDDCYEYWRQAKPAYNYRIDEMGLCEGIFGYWPCLYQRTPYKL